MSQLASGEEKFLGAILRHNAPPDQQFSNYFNQVSPENSGKWGNTEPERDQMSWDNLDSIYAYANRFGFPKKQHTFVWNIQQPDWIGSLTQEEQRAEVEEWIAAFCERYPGVDFIEPANEPIHQPASYRAALGGAGQTGWDWLIWVHKKAREYAPDAELILNEFDVLKKKGTRDQFIEIAAILKDSGLVDALGCQGHWMEGTSAATIRESLDVLDTLGLPIYITELDLSFAGDQQQLNKYKELFPVLWEHPAVRGITLWGYQEGFIWREQAYLLRKDGSERPALQWLRKEYFASSGVAFARISSPPSAQFHPLGDAGVRIEVEVDEGPSPVTQVDFYNGGQFLGSDEEAPFSFDVEATDLEQTYRISAVARSAGAPFHTNATSFGLMEMALAMPWKESFSLDNGTRRRRDSLAWNTMGEIWGAFSVQEGRFTANNMDGLGAWTCLTDISGTPGVGVEIDLQAAGGLDEGQDYVRVSYRLDGGEAVTLFYGDALFNGGNPLTVTADSLSGEELQIMIEFFNTGGSEYYYLDRVAITPLADPAGADNPEVPGFAIWPNPASGHFTLSLENEPVAGTEVRIHDLSGRLVFRAPFRQRECAFRHSLATGIYFLQLTAPGQKTPAKKLVIQ